MQYIDSRGPDRTRELGPEPTFHDPVTVTESELGAWTEFRAATRINQSSIGDYST